MQINESFCVQYKIVQFQSLICVLLIYPYELKITHYILWVSAFNSILQAQGLRVRVTLSVYPKLLIFDNWLVTTLQYSVSHTDQPKDLVVFLKPINPWFLINISRWETVESFLQVITMSIAISKAYGRNPPPYHIHIHIQRPSIQGKLYLCISSHTVARIAHLDGLVNSAPSRIKMWFTLNNFIITFISTKATSNASVSSLWMSELIMMKRETNPNIL